MLPSVNHPLVLHRLDNRRARRARETIGIQRVRIPENLLLVVPLVRFVRDDRNAFGHVRPHPPGMIRMVVRVDHVLDRLVRKHPLRVGDRRQRLFVAGRRLDDHDVVVELDEECSASRRKSGTRRRSPIFSGSDRPAAGRLPPPPRHPGRLPWRIAADLLMPLDCSAATSATVRSRIGIAALTQHDVHRKLHAAEISVLGVDSVERACRR